MEGWEGPPWSLLLPPGWKSLNGKGLAEIAAYQWTETNRIIMDDLTALPADRRHVVRYSDFVSDPAAVVRGIAAFADIDIDEALAQRTSAALPNSRYTLTAPDPDKWRKNAAEIEAVLPDVAGIAERLRVFR